MALADGAATSQATASQTQSCLDSGDGPRVGLVLSGGGARGNAHVGVLEILESLQVPVHCVVGTSFGAVVGALYASGQSASVISQAVGQVDWNRGFVDEIPREQFSIRRKEDFDAFQIRFELGVRGRSVNLPRGFIRGHGLHLLLKELLGPASLVNDFNQLPIPFRAVASDIENAESVAVATGDLATAVQASMAIPGVYEPVVIDGRLLVDGGVTRNLGIDIIKSMGADVVIAVDVGTPLAAQASLNSVVAIIDQLTNVVTHVNVVDQKALLTDSDILIQPALDGFAASDFSKSLEIVGIGLTAALAETERLQNLSVTPEVYESAQQRRRQLPDFPRTIGNLSIDHQSRLSTDVLLGGVDVGDTDQPFDTVNLHKSLNWIHSTGDFARVSYAFVENDDSVDLAIRADDKSWGPGLIRFGVALEDDLGGNSNFDFSLGYSRKGINSKGGELRWFSQIGERPRIQLDYFQPFDTLSEYYWQGVLNHEQYSVGEFDAGSQTAVYRNRRNEAGLFIGRQIGIRSDIKLGVVFGKGRIRRNVGEIDETADVDYDEGEVQLAWRYDTLDSIRFPGEGFRARLTFTRATDALGADNEYGTFNSHLLGAFKIDNVHFLGSVAMQTTTLGRLPLEQGFARRGIFNNGRIDQSVQTGQHVASLGGAIFRPVTSSNIAALDTPVYVGLSMGWDGVFNRRSEFDTNNLDFSVLGFVGADTPIGPVYLNVGGLWGEGVSASLTLGVGF